MIREHFTIEGTPKKAFTSRVAAQEFSNYGEQHLWGTGPGFNGDLREYKCGFCNEWHLGTWKEDEDGNGP